MPALWRLYRKAYGPRLDGTGGLFRAGRFHERGQRAVYFAGNPSTAVLEILVQYPKLTMMPSDYQLGKFEFERAVAAPGSALGLLEERVEENWMYDWSVTQSIGARWRNEGNSCLLLVPSVIVREENNFILNPEHAEASALKQVSSRVFTFDARLMGSR